MKKKLKLYKLIISLAVSHLAGLVGTVFTIPAIDSWYAGLVKPAFTPPGWLFGPVWLILYTLMGIALYLIWQQVGLNKYAKVAFWLFIVHLFFNSAWSIIFFGAQNISLALADIVVLWFLIIILEFIFARVDARASLLLLPYFLWVSFAAILNLSLWLLN